MIHQKIQQALIPHNLVLRGGFHCGATEEKLPDFVKSILLIGTIGSGFWPPTDIDLSEPHPFDSWTEKTLGPLARQFSASALYPFMPKEKTLATPEYHWPEQHWPFQQWALRADENLSPSPLGILIHADYGLWHGFRAAFAFEEKISLPASAPKKPVPCESCAEKPCLSTCPVEAFLAEKPYDVKACRGHLKSGKQPACMSDGCQARKACPVGREYSYDAGLTRFLMQAFI